MFADGSLITDSLTDEDYENFDSWLKKNSALELCTFSGDTLTVNSISTFISILGILDDKLNKGSSISELQLRVMRDTYKSFRYTVVACKTNREHILEDGRIFNITKRLLQKLMKTNIKVVEMILQFLINAVVIDDNFVCVVWECLQDVFCDLFNTLNYSRYWAVLMYNIMLKKTSINEFESYFSYFIKGVLDEDNEYYLYILEFLSQKLEFMNYYEGFRLNERLIILSNLQDLLMADDNDKFILSEPIIKLLIEQFNSKSDCILRTTTNDVDNLEPQEVVILLEVLASASAQDKYRKLLQEDKNLLINCAYLLKTVHDIGKQSQKNYFTPMHKLSDTSSSGSEAQNNPVFGFKASLIQFLGNMSWKSRANQDQLRELGYVPVLLDCCNIDARNPFIIQWTILAIRNLCEDNLENQQLIAGMSKQGVVDSSTLQEMGLTLHDDGTNRISLLPLPERNLK